MGWQEENCMIDKDDNNDEDYADNNDRYRKIAKAVRLFR